MVVLEMVFGEMLAVVVVVIDILKEQTAPHTMLALVALVGMVFLQTVALVLLVRYTSLITDHRRNYGNKKLRHKQLEIL
jgi:hypothetical protein